ncbi:hypothetical protein Gogos_020643 [Gossypium gossypioides]|uniref:CCHC-type domain-containing protein n=1 Tax=Gossypium gossypioides TaxID=34282 RepID=A0A7J9D3P4_GOSGO|nr:hypothetical protein [Gossypium gossypioides]
MNSLFENNEKRGDIFGDTNTKKVRFKDPAYSIEDLMPIDSTSILTLSWKDKVLRKGSTISYGERDSNDANEVFLLLEVQPWTTDFNSMSPYLSNVLAWIRLLVCFSCGWYGHSKDGCPYTQTSRKNSAGNAPTIGNPRIDVDLVTENDDFSPWILVERSPYATRVSKTNCNTPNLA